MLSGSNNRSSTRALKRVCETGYRGHTMHSTDVRAFLKIKRSDRFQINLKIFFVFEFVSIVFFINKKTTFAFENKTI